MIAASKRIVNNENASSSSAGESELSDDVRRSFVLSASGYRRSRGKTAPMISPIEDIEKFIRENQEEHPTDHDADNVRRTVSIDLPIAYLFPLASLL